MNEQCFTTFLTAKEDLKSNLEFVLNTELHIFPTDSSAIIQMGLTTSEITAYLHNCPPYARTGMKGFLGTEN